MNIDDLLTKLGLKYEELNKLEKETLNTWMQSLRQNKLTLEQVRGYVISMRSAVEQDLVKAKLGKRQDIYLKARLRNYMLLEAFMDSPKKAEEALERSLAGLKGA